MTSISRTDLQRQLRGKEVAVDDLRQAAIPQDVKAKLTAADTNGDGVISGTGEVNKLFKAADRFDNDGNHATVRAERNGLPTTAGAGLQAAVAAARPRRGLQGDQSRPATATTGTPSGAGPGRTSLDDSFRTARAVDAGALAEKLPAPAKHLAGAFVEAGRKHNVDPLLLVSISKHETANWTSSAFRNKNNAMGVSNRSGPIRMASHEASIDKMASLVGSTTSGPYKNATTFRELWGIYAPGPATGQGKQQNDPGNLNKHWGPNIIKNIDTFAAGLG